MNTPFKKRYQRNYFNYLIFTSLLCVNLGFCALKRNFLKLLNKLSNFAHYIE